MPSRSFIGPGAFGPEALAVMSEAYEAALASQPNVVREVIAGRIIAAAKLGERDPVRLREAALRTGGKLSASISSIEPANGGIVSSGKRFI